MSMYHILARLKKLAESNEDLTCGAVNEIILLRLWRAGFWREVMNSISDLHLEVDALKRGKLEFPCPTEKEVSWWNLCWVHRFMMLHDSGANVVNQDLWSSTLATEFARKVIQSSQRFDSDDDEVSEKVVAKLS